MRWDVDEGIDLTPDEYKNKDSWDLVERQKRMPDFSAEALQRLGIGSGSDGGVQVSGQVAGLCKIAYEAGFDGRRLDYSSQQGIATGDWITIQHSHTAGQRRRRVTP